MKTLQININNHLLFAPFKHIEDEKYTNYFDILKALKMVEQDTTISRILFIINSNGGIAQGLKEISDMMLKLKNKGVMIITYISGNCHSAAYYIACASHKIYSTNSASIGSIGACLTIDDGLKPDDDLKLRSKDAHFKNPDFPLDDEFKAYLQHNLDETGQEFIDYVKSQRDITDEIVFSGQSFKAKKALELNLIDEIIPLTEII